MKRSTLKRKTPLRAKPQLIGGNKRQSTAKLKKKLDQVLSQFIRLRDRGICFTCGVKKDWKAQQAGHYISRSHMATRWCEENVFCQCVGCNIFKHGAMDEYAARLTEKYGPEHLNQLLRLKRTIRKYSPVELEAMVEHYKIKVQGLLSSHDT